MRYLRYTFEDWPTRLAGLLFLLTAALVLFNNFSILPKDNVILGMFTFGMVPVLFIAGGIVFVIAILRCQKYDTSEQDRYRFRLPFLVSAGAASIILLVVGGYQLMDFTDSTEFCGELCHEVMYPEYTVYQDSPHSRVECANCHIGYGGGYLVRSKVSGIPQIWAVWTNSYPRPIPTPVENLRPAPDTCERCHRPDQFTGDLVITHTTFREDEANTRVEDTRILRVGTGQQEVAGDIHWHIAKTMWYLPLDDAEQDIAWVGVENPDGTLTEYVSADQESEITEERIEDNRHLMDCITCHNRAAHVFRSPGELIDTSMERGLINRDLPFIKQLGTEALEPPNASLEEAYGKIDAIKEYYQGSYPQIYSENLTEINRSLEELKRIAVLTTFPKMNVTWETYVDNAQHTASLGCFRCHGKLVSLADNETVVRIDCQLCHYFQININRP